MVEEKEIYGMVQLWSSTGIFRSWIKLRSALQLVKEGKANWISSEAIAFNDW